MAILKVARMGHPVLRRRALEVDAARLDDPDFRRLLRDMRDTVIEEEGVGLAAPQVFAPLRVVLVQLEDGEDHRVWVNPVLVPLTEERTWTMEGCLSVPGLRGLVGRPEAVEVRALDERGRRVALRLEGFPAVVAQHECDHLDGILYVDRVEPRTLVFLDEYRRWGAAGFTGEEE